MDMPDTPAAADRDALRNAEVARSELDPVTTDELAMPAAGYGGPAGGGSPT